MKTIAVAPGKSRYFSRAENPLSLFKIVLFFGAHIPLALVMRSYEIVSTVHAILTLGVGLILVLSKRGLIRAAYVGAYIVGAEVLWRMTDAGVYWEYGKYAVATVFIVAMLRHGKLKGPGLALLYFVLLLPSAVLTVDIYKWQRAQQALSFNLSGPFLLWISIWYFSHIRLSTEQLQRLFLMMLGPVVGVAAIALNSTYTAENLHFGGKSNRITSGGFGPNQVSSILGLGVLISFFSLLKSDSSRLRKFLLFAVMIVCGMQSALTFSRGGLYQTACAILVSCIYLLRDPRLRYTVLSVGGVLFLVANFVLLPRLDSFTGGELSSRFEDTSSTGRSSIFKADMEIWQENLILGVGPGVATDIRKEFYGHAIVAHTEFSRIFAEHGILGAGSFLVLIFMCLNRLKLPGTNRNRAFVAALVAWSMAYLLINAMRLAAPSFLFGLSFVILIPENAGVRHYGTR